MTENSYILHELDTEQETIDLPSLKVLKIVLIILIFLVEICNL